MGSKILDQRRVPSQDNEIDQRGRGLKRQQSVRFTGAEAIPRRRSISTRALQGSQEDRTAAASLRPRALTNNDPVPAAYRPPSRSSSIGKASIGKATAQSIVTALAAYDEYYTREDDIASTPSSYRRMRKSRSTRTLYSPKATSVPHTKVKDANDYNSGIWNRVPWIPSQQHDVALRAPKSMSFLRGGRDHMTPAVRQDHDTAVQMARDKFLHQIEQQRLREQPSFLFRAKARREERPFRQSVRSGSTNSYGIPVGSANQVIQSKGVSLRTKVRRASQTIKKKFNELFRRGGDQVEETKIPDQQVEARTSRVDNSYVAVKNSKQDEFFDVPHPDDATISGVASRVPSLHTVPSSQQVKSRNGSVRSQRSDGSMKSHVTSWTSTADNIATSRHAQAEREAQRLSIIQENGSHVPSNSIARSGLSNQFSAYPTFHRPRSANSRGAPSRGPVDSQKVYSALMKRLDDNSPTVNLDAQRVISGERYGRARRIPLRSTSVGSRHSSRESRTPVTIRHVKEEAAEWTRDGQMHDETLTPLPQENDDVFSPKPAFDTNITIPYHDDHNGSSIQRTVTSRMSSYVAYPPLNSGEGIVLPPQLLAARNERLMKPQKALCETRSTFFGNSSFTAPRSISPYRRALAEADYNPAVTTGEAPVGSGPTRILFSAPIIHCSDPKELANGAAKSDEAYSESVYSRTTSGRNPAAESSQSLALVEDDYRFGMAGSALQIDHKTYRPTGLNESRKSPSGSGEWQGRETLEASAVEQSKEGDGLLRINYALPSMPKSFCHFREHAQITEEETEVAQRKVSMPKQSIGILQQRTPQTTQLKPILKHKSSLSLDSFPLPQLPPPPAPPLPPPPPPPPVPMRSPLRPTQSRTSLRSIDQTILQQTLSAPSSANKHSSVTNHPLLHPNSLTNISRADTPTKLIKRNRRPSNDCDPSRGIIAAVEKQFGSAGSRTPCSGAENYSPAEAARNEHYGSNSAGHREIGGSDAQAMGSRVMVDMFLSSRRRKVAGSDESNAFL